MCDLEYNILNIFIYLKNFINDIKIQDFFQN
jgi:hypothetical protein